MGRVLASFSQGFDLVTDGGAVVILAWDGMQRGPMTVLLEPCANGDALAGLSAGMAFEVGMQELQLTWGRLPSVRVDLSGAARWEASLPWHELQGRREQIGSSAGLVSRTVAEAQHNSAGLSWKDRLIHATAELLGAQRCRDRGALKEAIRGLCGLGEGLTPQGDDWLAGWLLGLRVAEPPDQIGWTPEALGMLVLDVAGGRTTLMSRAFLACAAAGEAAESWHVLLSQMARDRADERALKSATRTILAHGATSGAAMLEGFLAGLGSALIPRPPISEETYNP